MQHKIVFLDTKSFPSNIEWRRPKFPHQWMEYTNTAPEQVIERLKDASIAIVNKACIDGDLLHACPKLEMIAIAATGTDIVDVTACKDRNVVVSNVRGYAVNTVPEHTFMLILALRRNLQGYHEDVTGGEWSRASSFCLFSHPINDLKGSQLGIVGNGSIGTAVATIGESGFGMEAVYLNHDSVSNSQRLKKKFLPFEEFIKTSDVISIHCPLTAKTKNLINADVFRQMKETAILINTARGAIVCEHDLVDAIERGSIAGAAVDVLSEEPPLPSHPYYKLFGRLNFILTPHVAWASIEAMQTLADMTVTNIENFMSGEPTNLVH